MPQAPARRARAACISNDHIADLHASLLQSARNSEKEPVECGAGFTSFNYLWVVGGGAGDDDDEPPPPGVGQNVPVVPDMPRVSGSDQGSSSSHSAPELPLPRLSDGNGLGSMLGLLGLKSRSPTQSLSNPTRHSLPKMEPTGIGMSKDRLIVSEKETSRRHTLSAGVSPFQLAQAARERAASSAAKGQQPAPSRRVSRCSLNEEEARRAALFCQFGESREEMRQAVRAVEAETELATRAVATDAAEAKAQLSKLRDEGAAGLLRSCRCACQLSRAHKVQRLALLKLQHAHLSRALAQMNDQSAKMWSGGAHPSPEGRDGALMGASAGPEAVLRSQSDVAAIQRRVEGLSTLYSLASARLSLSLGQAKLSGRDSRRRRIANLFRAELAHVPETSASSGSDGGGGGGGGGGGAPSGEARERLDTAARWHELHRLLLAADFPERAQVERWRTDVLRAVEPPSEPSAPPSAPPGAPPNARTDDDEAPPEALPPPPLVLPPVLPYVAHFAGKVCDAGGLPRATFLPPAKLLMGRVLYGMVEPALMHRAAAHYAALDAQFSTQQRRLRAYSPTQLEVERYVSADPTRGGAPELTPLVAILEELGAVCYAQTPLDFAEGVRAVVRAVIVHCSACTGEPGDDGAGAVGADILVPMMVLLVAHADLPRGYALLQLTKAYIEPAIANSEVGYCLCNFEAAVEHIRTCGDGF